MKFSEGGVNRVFAITFEHGDLLIDNLIKFVRERDVRNGCMIMLGALESGRLVAGPVDLTLPAAPLWRGFGDGREVIGVGTVAWEGETPRAHIHVAAGRDGESLLGCLREGGRVHIVIEAILFELSFDTPPTRAFDARTGAYLPKHEN